MSDINCIIHFGERSLPVSDKFEDVVEKLSYALRADNEHYSFPVRSGFGKRCIINSDAVDYIEGND